MAAFQKGNALLKRCKELDNKLAEAEAILNNVDQQIRGMKAVAHFLLEIGFRDWTDEDEKDLQERYKMEDEEDEQLKKALEENRQSS